MWQLIANALMNLGRGAMIADTGYNLYQAGKDLYEKLKPQPKPQEPQQPQQNSAWHMPVSNIMSAYMSGVAPTKKPITRKQIEEWVSQIERETGLSNEEARELVYRQIKYTGGNLSKTAKDYIGKEIRKRVDDEFQKKLPVLAKGTEVLPPLKRVDDEFQKKLPVLAKVNPSSEQPQSGKGRWFDKLKSKKGMLGTGLTIAGLGYTAYELGKDFLGKDNKQQSSQENVSMPNLEIPQQQSGGKKVKSGQSSLQQQIPKETPKFKVDESLSKLELGLSDTTSKMLGLIQQAEEVKNNPYTDALQKLIESYDKHSREFLEKRGQIIDAITMILSREIPKPQNYEPTKIEMLFRTFANALLGIAMATAPSSRLPFYVSAINSMAEAFKQQDADRFKRAMEEWKMQLAIDEMEKKNKIEALKMQLEELGTAQKVDSEMFKLRADMISELMKEEAMKSIQQQKMLMELLKMENQLRLKEYEYQMKKELEEIKSGHRKEEIQFREMLRQKRSGGGGGGGKDLKNLKKLGESIAYQLIGMGIDPNQLDAYLSMYRQSLRSQGLDDGSINTVLGVARTTYMDKYTMPVAPIYKR